MFEPEELMARIVDLEEQLKVSEMAPPAAEQLIACLEGEIAKRDARIEAQEDQINILQSDANSWQSGYDEGRRMGAKHAAPVPEAKAQGVVMQASNFEASNGEYRNPGYEGQFDGETVEQAEARRHWATTATELATARLNAAPVQQVSVPDERIIPTSAELIQWAWEEDPEETRFQEGYNAAKRWVKMQIEASIAAPEAPAADAGMVDMYRHLQKVTPYRFKKIQDASITDGGDVMYFHKDRFDAALLADMAAHCAAKGVV